MRRSVSRRSKAAVAPLIFLALVCNGVTAVLLDPEISDTRAKALTAGADRLLLDNMDPPMLRQAVMLVAGRAPLEASGGVTLETIRFIAETGVNFISVGRITQSAAAVDIGLDYRLGH